MIGVDCLAARAAQRKQLRDYYVPISGRLLLLRAYVWAPITCQHSGAYGINIKGLGGKTCHCTGCGNIGIWVHRVWEYRDIGRLFITVGGEESDNRGAEVGLWVEVILRVSLEVILHNLLRHSSTG